jgi:hypothetical protein
MEITYTLTPEDVVAFNRHQFETSPSLQRSYRMGFLWGVLAAAAFYLILGAWDNPWNALFPALFLIIYLIWYPLTIRRNLSRVGQRMKTEGANRRVWGRHTLTLSETELTAESEFEYSRLRWAGVERVDLTETHIFIYDSTTSAHVIPKRCFADLQAAQAFYHAAKNYSDRARG